LSRFFGYNKNSFFIVSTSHRFTPFRGLGTTKGEQLRHPAEQQSSTMFALEAHNEIFVGFKSNFSHFEDESEESFCILQAEPSE
jgi:hypothetical protein